MKYFKDFFISCLIKIFNEKIIILNQIKKDLSNLSGENYE